VCSTDAKVRIYVEEDDTCVLHEALTAEAGRALAPASTASASSPAQAAAATLCTALAWHPVANLLALGWDDGSLSLWREGAGTLLWLPADPERASAVTALAWSTADRGARLVRGDSSGLITIFAVDARAAAAGAAATPAASLSLAAAAAASASQPAGPPSASASVVGPTGPLRLQPIRRLTRHSAIAHLVFKPLSAADSEPDAGAGAGTGADGPDSAAAGQGSRTWCQPFFFATKAGTAFQCGSTGACAELASYGSALHGLRWDPRAQALALLGLDAGYLVVRVGADGHRGEERRVRLSVTVPAHAKAAADGAVAASVMAWVGDGSVVAAAAEEPVVRLWSLRSAHAFTLPLPPLLAASGAGGQPAKAVSVAYDAVQRLLLVGTDSCHVCLWRWVASARGARGGAGAEDEGKDGDADDEDEDEGPSEADWVPLPPLRLADAARAFAVRHALPCTSAVGAGTSAAAAAASPSVPASAADALVAASLGVHVVCLKPSQLANAACPGWSVIQYDSTTLAIERTDVPPPAAAVFTAGDDDAAATASSPGAAAAAAAAAVAGGSQPVNGPRLFWRLPFVPRTIVVRDGIVVASNGRKAEVADACAPVTAPTPASGPDSASAGAGVGTTASGPAPSVVGRFVARTRFIAVGARDSGSLFIVPPGSSRIEVINYQGVVKAAIPLATDAEGAPTHLALAALADAATAGTGGSASAFLACATAGGVLKLWDVTRREPRVVVAARHVLRDPAVRGTFKPAGGAAGRVSSAAPAAVPAAASADGTAPRARPSMLAGLRVGAGAGTAAGAAGTGADADGRKSAGAGRDGRRGRSAGAASDASRWEAQFADWQLGAVWPSPAGTRVAFTVRSTRSPVTGQLPGPGTAAALGPDSRLFVYDAEADTVAAHDFGAPAAVAAAAAFPGAGGSDAGVSAARAALLRVLPVAVPVAAAWDPAHPALLAVELRAPATAAAAPAAGGAVGPGSLASQLGLGLATRAFAGSSAAAVDADAAPSGLRSPMSNLGGSGSGDNGAAGATVFDVGMLPSSASASSDTGAGPGAGARAGGAAGAAAAAAGASVGAVATVIVAAGGDGHDALTLHDSFPLGAQALAAVSVPYVVTAGWADARAHRRVLRDFAGLEGGDAATLGDILAFSAHLAQGRLDDAYRAVRRIAAPAVWRNMAVMAVQTKRLDVARVCLSQMGNVRGAWVLRAAAEQDALTPSIRGASGALTAAAEAELDSELAGAGAGTGADGGAAAEGGEAAAEGKQQGEEAAALAAAALALELGLPHEAERLYAEAGRADLVARAMQLDGRFHEAVLFCEREARVHAPAAHFALARHAELAGDADEAARQYTLADAHRGELARALVETGQPGAYRRMEATRDPRALQWLGRYCMAKQAWSEALRCFTEAKAVGRVVEAYVRMGEGEKAYAVCKASGDAAACLTLARHLDASLRMSPPPVAAAGATAPWLLSPAQTVDRAVELYVLARRYASAVQLCMAHGLDAPLQRLALEAPAAVQLEAARFFEARGAAGVDQAVLLYQRGGNPARAVELCFQHQRFDPLQRAVEDLGADADPQLLRRCADFFVAHGEFNKAVPLLVTARAAPEALALCAQHNVLVTDDMAERLTPPKLAAGAPDEAEAAAARQQVLLRLGQLCSDQGSYQLACKKYTQAGDRLRAMKALLRSKDVEKICYYAQMTKKRELYILAARFLERLDWRADADLAGKITQFYTLARAMQALAAFHEAQARVQVDEHRDYTAAHDALRRSLAALQHARAAGPEPGVPAGQEVTDAHVDGCTQRLLLVQRFTEARGLLEADPEQMLRECYAVAGEAIRQQQHLAAALGQTQLAGVRAGDAYALVVEYCSAVGDNARALEGLYALKGAGLKPLEYVGAEVVEGVCRAQSVDSTQLTGQPPQQQQQQQQQQYAQGQHQGGGYEIEEDI
jgi:intraflagellar transport protein 140